MDESVSPSQPTVFTAPQPSFFSKYWGGAVVVVIILFTGLILILNYFNILPLSTKFPKYFAFLPHQTISQNNTQASVMKSDHVFLFCPLPKEFCGQGKEIASSGPDLGLGFTLPANTPLFAPFDGSYKMIWQDSKEGTSSATLEVTETNSKFSAIYLFVPANIPVVSGKPIVMRQEYPIKRGQEIVKVSGKPVSYRFDPTNSLVFYVYRGITDDPAERITLQPSDLTRIVDLTSQKQF